MKHDLPYERVAVSSLKFDGRNARKHDKKNLKAIKDSLTKFGQQKPIVVTKDNTVIAGNGTLAAAKELGWETIDISRSQLTKDEAIAYGLADNRSAELAAWDDGILGDLLSELDGLDWDIEGLGWDAADLESLVHTGEAGRGGSGDKFDDGTAVKGSLAAKFGVPPFSVLNARDGAWQARKDEWISGLGIASEIGRAENLIGYSLMASINAGTSVFDPVLCELAYRWFSNKKDIVLDPFAGGSVRGIVAGCLGRAYYGVDLRPEQVAANAEQAKAILPGRKGAGIVEWRQGDSCNIDKILAGCKYDLIMSCPPYADLEKYSDDAGDLSNMPYEKFLEAYRLIIKKCYGMLANDRFAVWTVGEVRAKNKNGSYLNFVGDTISAFTDAGFEYYNESILVTAVGSLPIRAAKIFNGGRKLAKTHQNVLVFVKGSAKKAAERCEELGDEFFASLAAPLEGGVEAAVPVEELDFGPQ